MKFRRIVSKYFPYQTDGNGRMTSNDRSIGSGRIKLDGFTMISNIQLECLKMADLTKNELRLLLYLLRNITGWTDRVPDGYETVKRKDGRSFRRKKFKKMPRTQIEIISRQVARELGIHNYRFLKGKNGLIAKRVVIENGDFVRLNLINGMNIIRTE